MMHFAHPLPRLLFRLALVCGLLTVAVALMQVMAAGRSPSAGEQAWPMTVVMLPFFLGFAFFKGALALDTQLTLRQGGPAASALLAQHGSSAGVRQWIVYKYAATTMALIATAVIAVLVLRS